MNELALFAGAGGGILGGKLLGWRTVCAVEIDPYAASVLAARQNDGLLSPFPIWDDVCTFDGRPWRGVVDVVSGGFPCQDISAAGKGEGIDGARSGLWREMARIIGEVRPRYAFVENSPMLTSRGLGRVLGDLAEMGFDARWGVLGAATVGAPHLRERIWIVASDANGGGHGKFFQPQQIAECGDTPNTWSNGKAWAFPQIRNAAGAGLSVRPAQEVQQPQADEEFERSDWWATEPDVGRVVNGLAARVDRLKAIGNGQVPQCAAAAWTMLSSNKI